MSRSPDSRCRSLKRLVCAVAAVWSLGGETTSAQDPPADLPAWQQVEETVRKHLSTLKGRRNGDLLSQGDVQPLFVDLQKLGWSPRDEKALLDSVLPDGDFLIRELRSKRGTPFMRQLAGTPGGFASLDKLRTLPSGQKKVRELIAGPEGYKLIQYLATTPGGKNLGRQLSKSRGGKAFRKPTKRLYTEQDLLKALRESYSSEMIGDRSEVRPR